MCPVREGEAAGRWCRQLVATGGIGCRCAGRHDIRSMVLRVDWPDGFGLVRASNTTPVLVLRFEGQTQAEALDRIQKAMLMAFVATALKPDAALVRRLRIEFKRLRKVLIVKLSSLGDVVHAMPAVQDLRSALPGVPASDWGRRSVDLRLLLARCEGVSIASLPCDYAASGARTPSARCDPRRSGCSFKTVPAKQEAYDAVIDLQGPDQIGTGVVGWRGTTPDRPAASCHGPCRPKAPVLRAPARWVADTGHYAGAPCARRAALAPFAVRQGVGL